MVHANTKHGPVVTEGTDGFPIPEGFFCVSGKGKEAKRQAGELGGLPTAEFLWQAKHATGELSRRDDRWNVSEMVRRAPYASV